ncbi:MAG TPA: cytidine/deoxycytidylate deaminase family protein [Candidatus Norongarragalinales archaeon]|nr:cytidine/deoxycytidylate deaminase family protein [Candidatus Norongarragalinales archaeon]
MPEAQHHVRPSWDEYFVKIAEMVAQRATCPRKRLGSVIVKEKRIIATGYNGSPPGQPHCDEVGCKTIPTHVVVEGKDVVKDHCVRTLHAEQNAIIQCALHGVSCEGATIYLTINPCYLCAKMIVASGIKRVVYKGDYFHDDKLDHDAMDLFAGAGVQVEKFLSKA